MRGSESIKIIKGKSFSDALPAFFQKERMAEVYRFHNSISGYKRTPLISLDSLARSFGVKGIYVKDESYRFGLNAFKSLGATYAIAKIAAEKAGFPDEAVLDYKKLTSEDVREKISELTFVTATDGNHGKGVAWAAAALGCKAYVFMPKGSQECRADAIRAIDDTKVEITDLNYMDAVRFASDFAAENGYILVQDTGFEGYEVIPNNITLGYTTMAREAHNQLKEMDISATHMFLQAGVGSMAGGVLGFFTNETDGHPPITVICEPETVACIYKSAKAGDGKPHEITGMPETIMAGLNCGEPNIFTWPVLRDFASFYASCPDAVTENGMGTLANPLGSDQIVVSGESGAVGLGLLEHLCREKTLSDYKNQIGLDENSVILLFSSEGDTDPESYNRIIGSFPCLCYGLRF